DGLDADGQLRCDLLGRGADCEVPQHLRLTGRQVRRIGRRLAADVLWMRDAEDCDRHAVLRTLNRDAADLHRNPRSVDGVELELVVRDELAEQLARELRLRALAARGRD